jgi:purine-binding chemotaxis protein CheW
MNETPMIENKAAELRQAFDLSFALPPPQASQEVEDLLTIRVAGDPYAIRLCDIAGMVTGRKVVPLPAATLDLLGLAGIRGGIVPVFGLSSILRYQVASTDVGVRAVISIPLVLATIRNRIGHHRPAKEQ